jgi:translocation and assembly module TamB
MRVRRGIFLGLLLSTLLALAAGAWLLASEAGLRTLAGVLERMAPGTLELAGARGRVFGPLSFERLQLRRDALDIVAEDVALDWSPRRLLRGELAIDRLRMASLAIRDTSTTPPAPPQHLRPPLALTLADIDIAELRLDDAPPLRALRASLRSDAGRHALALRHVAGPWGEAEGELSLHDSAPFELHGVGRVRGRGGHTLDLTLSGTLQRLHLTGEAQAPLQMRAELEWLPFAPIPLHRLNLTLRDFDPAAWHAGLPGARLSGSAEFSGTADGRLSGSVRIDNASSGGVEQGRLPVRAAQAHLHGTPGDVRIEDLLLDLGAGGRLAGAGQYRGGRLALRLGAHALDPRALHGRLRAMRLAGDVALEADTETQRVRVSLRDGVYRVAADVRHHQHTLHIAEARLGAGRAGLSLAGSLARVAPYRFHLQGWLERFDPAAFGDFPRAEIHARLAAQGTLSPQPAARIDFELAPGRWRDQTLGGSGRLRLSPQRLDEIDVAVTLGDNALRVQGALGRASDRLAWQLRADALAQLSPGLRGSLRATGELQGGHAAPAIAFELSAADLAWGAQGRLARLRAHGDLAAGPRAALTLDAEAETLVVDGLTADRAALHVRGRRDAHDIELHAASAANTLRARLRGGWVDAAWRGTVESLTLAGTAHGRRLVLQRPAALRMAPTAVELGEAELHVAGARLRLRETRWTGDGWASRGEIDGLAWADVRLPLARRLPPLAQWRGDLVLAGAWNLRAGPGLAGEARVWRERGDLRMPGEPAMPLDLRDLRAQLQARDGRVRADVHAEGRQLGRLAAWTELPWVRRAGRIGIAGDAPLAGAAEVDLRSLAWLPSLLGTSDWRAGGSVKARVTLGGTAATPRMQGELTATGLRLDWPEYGLHLERGELRASFMDTTLRLDHLVLRGGDGELRAQGTIDWPAAHPVADIRLQAQRLRVLSRPDRLLEVSGSGHVDGADGALRVRGELRAERARMLLARADTPTRSDDVVVLGRVAPERGALPRVEVDVKLDLGDDFLLQGRGLDLRLGGSLRARAPPGVPPRLTGSVAVVRGSYAAYGQRLDIERGILTFQGPVDNPGLDILALRRNQPVEAGVAITGTALAPRARLVSRPEVPDGDKLSWLVLGRGGDDLARGDIDVLSAAAGALLAAGESVALQARLAQATGLDEIGLRGGGALEQTVVTLGKRLSSRAYLGYEQGVTGLGGLVKLDYRLTRRWSLQARSGRENSVDLFYTFRFD